MQKNKMIMIVTVVAVVAISVAFYFSKKQKSDTNPVSQAIQMTESNCDSFLTLEDVKTISGLPYAKVDVSSQKSNKITVLACTYTAPGLSSTVKPISVLVRSATSVEEAKAVFEESKTVSYTDREEISGIGENALWSNTLGQVSFLKGKTWTIVSTINNKDLAIKIATFIK